MNVQQGCITSNEDQHLALPCSLHVLSSSGEFSINRIHRLLKEEFQDVVGYEPFQNLPPAFRVYHFVETADAAPPTLQGKISFRRKVSHCQGRWMRRGVICSSNSPWSSPLHMVRKKNGSWCPCEDY